MKNFVKYGFVALMLVAVIAGNASALTTSTLPEGPTNETGLLAIVQTGLNYVFTAFIVVAIIFIIMAAFSFVTGGADGAKEGRQKLMWAAVGIAIALIAKGLPVAIKSIVAPV